MAHGKLPTDCRTEGLLRLDELSCLHLGSIVIERTLGIQPIQNARLQIHSLFTGGDTFCALLETSLVKGLDAYNDQRAVLNAHRRAE